jgi:hypothetical protein
MTSKDFRSGLQAELDAAGFNVRVFAVAGTTTHTQITFAANITPTLLAWLNKRFTNGVKAVNLITVHINTPNEKKQ